jgi:hypothetical protein
MPTGMSAGGPLIPGGQAPNMNGPTDPAAAPAVDPNNPVVRRRRFQNLPQ